MKLIVGLGNIGKKYEKTRHNIGFMCLDNYAKISNLEFKNTKFDAIISEIIINNEKILLAKPTTYMNNSGIAVKKIIEFYKIPIENILIIQDDLDMPCGKIKLRPKGSSGGQNGIKDIINHLGTHTFSRLKIGIANDKSSVVDHVLSPFSKQEINLIEDAIITSSQIIDDFVNCEIAFLMNKYNKK